MGLDQVIDVVSECTETELHTLSCSQGSQAPFRAPSLSPFHLVPVRQALHEQTPVSTMTIGCTTTDMHATRTVHLPFALRQAYMFSNFDDPSSQSASDIAQTVSFFLCKCLLLAFITHVSVGKTHENKFILLYTDIQNDSSCCVKPYARRCGVSWRKRPTKRQQPTLQCRATVPTSQAIPDQLFVTFTQTAVTNTRTCTCNTHMHAHTHAHTRCSS